MDSALKGFRNVLFIFIVFITPLFFLFYFLCWTGAKITALIYVNDKRTMLSGEDVLATLGDNPVNRIMNGFYLIQDRFTVDELKQLLMDKVIQATDDNNRPLFPKFTCRIIRCADYLLWSEDDSFNIDDHIRLHHGQRPRNEDELKRLLNGICNTALPPSKPCWEFLIIPLEYEQDKEPKTCMLVRVDHTISDAVSLGRLFYERMAIGNIDDAMKTIVKNIENNSKNKNKFVTMLQDVAQYLFAFVVAPSSMCRQGLMCIPNKFQRTAQRGGQMIDWTTTVKLSTVKEIKNATGTTVNDVFMSCTAAALRKFFVEQSVSPPATVQVAFPVSHQGPNDPITMKNKISFLLSQLPTGDMDCLQRLRTTKALMDKLKRSHEVITNRWFIHHYVRVIPHTIMRFFMKESPDSVIVSNVPGPFSPPAFNGHPLQTAVAFPQIRGNAGVGVAILSYAGDVVLSVSVDTAIVSNEDSVRWLLDGFVDEMQQLHKTVVK